MSDKRYFLISIESSGDRLLVISDSRPTIVRALELLNYDDESKEDLEIVELDYVIEGDLK